MYPKLLLKGARAFSVYFLSRQTRGEGLRGTAAGFEVAEVWKKKFLGAIANEKERIADV